MSREIYTALGAIELVEATIASSDDLTSATVQLAVGTYSAPGAWAAPDSHTVSSDGHTVTAGLLIGNGHTNPVAGRYYLWVRVVDGAQILIEPQRAQSFTTTDVTGTSVSTWPAFAPASADWAPDTAYAQGQLVTHAGALYAATVDFTSGASFSTSDLLAIVGGVGATDNGNGTFTI